MPEIYDPDDQNRRTSRNGYERSKMPPLPPMRIPVYAIILIVVGALVLILVTCILILCIKRRGRRRRMTAASLGRPGVKRPAHPADSRGAPAGELGAPVHVRNECKTKTARMADRPAFPVESSESNAVVPPQAAFEAGYLDLYQDKNVRDVYYELGVAPEPPTYEELRDELYLQPTEEYQKLHKHEYQNEALKLSKMTTS